MTLTVNNDYWLQFEWTHGTINHYCIIPLPLVIQILLKMYRCWIKRQVAKLTQTQPHIVIGTPGRIFDLMQGNASSFKRSKWWSWWSGYDIWLRILRNRRWDRISYARKLQMSVFSATIPDKIKPFLKKYLGNNDSNREYNSFPSTIKSIACDKGKIQWKFVNYWWWDTLTRAYCKQKQKPMKSLKTSQSNLTVKDSRRYSFKRTSCDEQIQQMDYQFVVATDLAATWIDIEGVSRN